MGEYFSSTKSVGLFDSVTDLKDDRYIPKGKTEASNRTTLEANAIHEMSHGLIEPIYLKQWVDKLDFWFDEDTESGDIAAEEPPTGYGHTSAGEDLAESVAIYFTNRPALKLKCPEREKFIAGMVRGWTPRQKKTALTTATGATGTGP
jgi:hypothetical protein